MTTAESIVIILIICILLFVGITYFLHGRKVDKKKKDEKKSAKPEEKKNEEKVATPPEEKPVPVGIIRQPQPKPEAENQPEYDLAPLKDKSETKSETQKTQNLKTDIKNLSPEMKKVIMSDLLKPKF